MTNVIKKLVKKISKLVDKSEGQQIWEQLEARLANVETTQKDMQKIIIEKCWNIEKVQVEKIETEKVEFSFDTIDVKELSGMLSIGINSDCELIKKENISKASTPKESRTEKTTTSMRHSNPKESNHKESSLLNNTAKVNIYYSDVI